MLLPLWQVSVLGLGWYLGVWQVLLCGQQYVIVTHLQLFPKMMSKTEMRHTENKINRKILRSENTLKQHCRYAQPL